MSQATRNTVVAKQPRKKWGFKTMSGKTKMRASKRTLERKASDLVG